MAERFSSSRRPGSQIPIVGGVSVPVAGGRANATFAISRVLGDVASRFHDRADMLAEEQAREEGVQAGGASVPPQLRDATTIRGKAFNRAAVSTFTSGVELKARQEVSRLYGEFSNNPAELSSRYKAFAAGMAEQLGALDPAARDAFLLSFETISQPYVARAKDAAFKAAQDRAEASAVELEAQTDIDIDQLSEGILSDSPEVAASTSTALGAHLNTLRQHYEQTDPATGERLFSRAEQAKAEQRFYDRVIVSGVRQWYKGQEDKTAALMSLLEDDLEISLVGADGEVQQFKVRQQLSLDKLDQLENDLISEMRFENAMRDRREADAEKALERLQELRAFNMWEQVYRAGDQRDDGSIIAPLAPQDIRRAVEAGEIAPEDGSRLMDATLFGFAERDDLGVVDELEELAYSGQDISGDIMEHRGQLKSATASRLRTLNNSLVNQREGNFDPVGEQRKLLREQLGPGGLFEFDPADARARRAAALTEYDARVREEDADPVALRQELVDRAARDTPVFDSTATLIKPRFAVAGPSPDTINVEETVRKLKAERDAGRLSAAEYAKQLRLAQQWLLAQQKNERERATGNN